MSAPEFELSAPAAPREAALHHHDGGDEHDASTMLPTTTTASLSSSTDGLVDNVRTMMEQERTTYAYRNYASNSTVQGAASTPAVDSAWREQICDWSMGVVDHFGLSRETVAVALALLDRYLATLDKKTTADDSGTTLLAAITTMHIAIKIHESNESNGTMVRLETLCKLSRGLFVQQDVERMEWTILKALGWHVHPPTSIGFVGYLLQFLLEATSSTPQTHELYVTARYLAELSVCEGYFVDHCSSDIAFAAILLSANVRGVSHGAFEKTLADAFGLHTSSRAVVDAYEVLREMYDEALGGPRESLISVKSRASVALEEFSSPARTSPSTVITEESSGSPSLRRTIDFDVEGSSPSSAKRSRTYSTDRQGGQPAAFQRLAVFSSFTQLHHNAQ